MSMMLLTSCYHRQNENRHAGIEYNEQQLDSISFSSTHHYTNNYNFIVKADSVELLRQLPEELVSNMPTDSFSVMHNKHLVVASIRMVPTDSIDSVWVQLGTEQAELGWIHESKLLPLVVPADPISQFISTFSDTHLLIFLIIITLITAAYILHNILSHKAKMVHFNDIDSLYPTVLSLLVASAAALYASIQMFWPEVWQQFYFHPTLNPFSVPPILAVFLCSVWAMLIIAVAAVDDVRHQLTFGSALLYLSGLAGMCAINYIVFSITTLYYVGYVLLIMYYYFALRSYFLGAHRACYCGNCGERLHRKGRCPNCGAMNI